MMMLRDEGNTGGCGAAAHWLTVLGALCSRSRSIEKATQMTSRFLTCVFRNGSEEQEEEEEGKEEAEGKKEEEEEEEEEEERDVCRDKGEEDKDVKDKRKIKEKMEK
ncbi:hypothetical protein E2C01_066750 [Portunus trituberculatus]|uniref:Uncharacterized protein n=1 Tax=Portunus trituberculatus TaxID=210409 RepID=A0A5B7HVI2_PORTR|nr:hypothetical protein [Portunus trituberculatus]